MRQTCRMPHGAACSGEAPARPFARSRHAANDGVGAGDHGGRDDRLARRASGPQRHEHHAARDARVGCPLPVCAADDGRSREVHFATAGHRRSLRAVHPVGGAAARGGRLRLLCDHGRRHRYGRRHLPAAFDRTGVRHGGMGFRARIAVLGQRPLREGRAARHGVRVRDRWRAPPRGPRGRQERPRQRGPEEDRRGAGRYPSQVIPARRRVPSIRCSGRCSTKTGGPKPSGAAAG